MPRKGAFARCVESVSERGGVSDPHAVCAASIAKKRGRTRGRVNAASWKYRGYTIRKEGRIFQVISHGEVIEEAETLASAKIYIDHFAYGDTKYEDSHPGYGGYGTENPEGRRTRGRVNVRGAKREKQLLGVAKQLALAGAGPAALLMGNPALDLVYAADGAGQQSGREWPSGKKLSTTAMDREFKDWLEYRKHSIPGLASLSASDRKQLRGVFFRGVRQGYKPNPATRKNAGARTAEEAFEDFHGHAPEETITFDSVHHYPGKTAAIGDLVELDIRVPAGRGLRNRYVHLDDFGEAWLTRHPRMKQLYVEGGDQSLDLSVFGLDDKDPHEIEYLGELVRCVYFTRKDHLGDQGGEADYHHRFGKNELTLKKTELIKVGYHVPDEQLIFMGGGYEIPAEGIDG